MLARGLQLLEALVAACLVEEIDGGWHVGWRAVSVEVQPVRSRRDRREFVDLPFRLHGTGTPWVPPLKLERHAVPRARASTPSFATARPSCSSPAATAGWSGRVSAQIDLNFNAYHDNAWGMFGFLEFEEDPEVLGALLEAAAAWLRERGRDRMVGPMDFTMNDESGVLIEGFERRPMLRQPWQPPYYQRAAARRPASRRRGPVHVDARHLRARQGDADHLGARRAARAQARDHDPQDDPARAAPRPRRLRRDLQRGLVAQLGLRALREGRPRRLRPGAPPRVRPRLVHGGRERRWRDRRRGDHRPRRQRGAR